jgi:hypothetical protein
MGRAAIDAGSLVERAEATAAMPLQVAGMCRKHAVGT